jgi:Histidine kinase-like ATPase domain
MATLDSSLEPPPLELRARSHPGCVTEVRRRIAEYAKAEGANRDDVELAVAEAVGNAVAHAFAGRDDGTIIVRARIEALDWLVVEVVDSGSGITTTRRSARAGFGAADHRCGGRQGGDADRAGRNPSRDEISTRDLRRERAPPGPSRSCPWERARLDERPMGGAPLASRELEGSALGVHQGRRPLAVLGPTER